MAMLTFCLHSNITWNTFTKLESVKKKKKKKEQITCASIVKIQLGWFRSAIWCKLFEQVLSLKNVWNLSCTPESTLHTNIQTGHINQSGPLQGHTLVQSTWTPGFSDYRHPPLDFIANTLFMGRRGGGKVTSNQFNLKKLVWVVKHIFIKMLVLTWLLTEGALKSTPKGAA